MQLLPGAEPFRSEAGPRRVLLLHGFGSTPFEMRYLAERLQGAGFTSVCPLLPGHGSRKELFARTGWADWLACAQDALRRLQAESAGAPVAVVGQSLGALLALQLAAQAGPPLACIACLATPLSFSPLSGLAVAAYRFTPLRLLDLEVPRSGGADIREPRLRRGLPGYDETPLKAAASFAELQRRTVQLLGRVRAPLLVLHGKEDHTAPPANAERLMAAVASRDKRLTLLPQSYHVLSLDVDRAQAAEALLEHLERNLPLAPPA